MTSREIDALRDWLVKEGYPLEYEAARELARVGFRAWQGRFYQDPDSKDYREIDVRADEPEAQSNPWKPIFVVVECKNNSKPWLVLTTKLQLEAGYGRNFLITSRVQPQALIPSQSQDAGFVLNVPIRHGYSVIQSMSGSDAAYGALRSVTKAAVDSVSRLVRTSPAIALPIIVLAGSLYQLGFDDDGAEILEPVVWQRVIWHGLGERSAVQIDVVTREHLPRYLHSLRAATRALASILATSSS